MPEFNAKCDDCKVTFRAWVYGYRAKRVATCPRCGNQVKSYRKAPLGYIRIVFQGMRDGRAIWEASGSENIR